MTGEEIRLRTIIAHTADGIVIVDGWGVVRFVNPAAEALFGRPAGELIGEMFGFPVVAGQTTEVELVRGDGEAVVAELRVAEIEWDGTPAQMATLRDVTDRKRAEERTRQLTREQAARAEAEAAERRARFLADASALLESSLDSGGVLADLARLAVPRIADWCLIDVLDGAGEPTRAAQAHADPTREFALAELRERFPLTGAAGGLAASVLRTGEPVVHSMVDPTLLTALAGDPDHARLLHRLGAASLMAVPIRARGQVLGVVTFGSGERRFGDADLALARDLGQRIALAVSNARLYQRAQEASRAKSDFLAVISHELRTPLNAIMGYTALLSEGVTGPLNPKQEAQLGRIDASSRHLLGLVEEILAFARLEAGRNELVPETVDLGTLVGEVASLIGPLAREKGVEFRVQAPPEPVPVRTDPGKVRQILLNLLSNAVKFTDAGEVVVEQGSEDDGYRIRVRDTGIGIATENLERIWEPFWQVEQSNRRQLGGTGLGLSVAHQLAELLGGSMTAESTEGAGSTFTLRIPRDLPDRP